MPLFVEIRTPENVRLRHPVAGLASRAEALGRDMILQTFAAWGGIMLLGGVERHVGRSLADALAFLLVFLVFAGYHILFEMIWDGRTPGKRAVGLRVVMRDGQRVQFHASAIRNALRAADWLPALFLAGIATIFATPDHRRLGDLAAGTLVVRDEDFPALPAREDA